MDHYQTVHLLAKVHGNYVSLHDNAEQEKPRIERKDWPNPRKAGKWLTTKLNELFEGGAILAFESDFGWDDEGGNCHQAFILKAEYVRDYSDRFVDSNDPTFPIRYFASNPKEFWILWQGPY